MHNLTQVRCLLLLLIGVLYSPISAAQNLSPFDDTTQQPTEQSSPQTLEPFGEPTNGVQVNPSDTQLSGPNSINPQPDDSSPQSSNPFELSDFTYYKIPAPYRRPDSSNAPQKRPPRFPHSN